MLALPVMPPATLDTTQIALRVPHKGAMCLLDSVESWSEENICAQASVKAKTNPLAVSGKIASSAAIEYAAQAMAVHGALLGEVAAAQGKPQRKPLIGFLASVRSIVCHRPWLHELTQPMRITATRTAGTESPVSYDFSVSSDDMVYVTGKATVVLNFA